MNINVYDIIDVMISHNFKVMIGLVVSVIFVLIIFFIPQYLDSIGPKVCMNDDGTCQHEIEIDNLQKLVPFFIGAGVVIGVIISFFLNGCSKPNPVQTGVTHANDITNGDILDGGNQNVVDDLVTGELVKSSNMEVILSLLKNNERKIISYLIQNDGKVLQSEISRLDGIGKVKAHRHVAVLIKRGIIIKESQGKTNMLFLSNEIKKLFNL